MASTRPTSALRGCPSANEQALLPWANHEEQPASGHSRRRRRRRVVRLGCFEARPFQVACARGWFDLADVTVACLPQAAGGYVVAKLDEGDLEVALLGSTPAAFAVARGRRHQDNLRGPREGLVAGVVGAARNQSPPDLGGRTFGTPFGSTAHYHMMYIQTLFPDVRFDIIDLNGLNPLDLYDAGTIDGAFVWGGWIDGLVQRNATMLFPARGGARIKFHGTFMARSDGFGHRRGSTATKKRERENERWHRRRDRRSRRRRADVTPREEGSRKTNRRKCSATGASPRSTRSARARTSPRALRRPRARRGRHRATGRRLLRRRLDAFGAPAPRARLRGRRRGRVRRLGLAGAGRARRGGGGPLVLFLRFSRYGRGARIISEEASPRRSRRRQFHLGTNTVAAVAPAGTVDEDAFYAATTIRSISRGRPREHTG